MNHSSYLKIVRLKYAHADGTHALEMENIVLPLGKISVMCGRNGAGKSLMALALSGLLPQAEIEVTQYQRHNILRTFRNAELRRYSGIIFQNSEHQIIGQSVRDDIAFGLKNLRLPSDEITKRVNAMMELCDLNAFAHRHPLSLSGGEMRRVAIAGMLVLKPKILLLDEPFNNLDWHAQRRLSELIIDIRKEGITPLIVTHTLSAVHEYAEWMLILQDGKVAAVGPPRDVVDVAVRNNIIGDTVARALKWH